MTENVLEIEDGKIDVNSLLKWVAYQRRAVPMPDVEEYEHILSEPELWREKLRASGIEEECRGARTILRKLDEHVREAANDV